MISMIVKFQFIGGFSLLSPIKNEFRMLDEILDTSKAFSQLYCDWVWEVWGYPLCPRP